MANGAKIIRAQVRVRSGVPNPGFELSAEEVDRIRDLLALPLPSSPAPEYVIGYNGFTLVNENAVPGLPVSIRIYDGRLEAFDGSSRLSFADVRGVEEFLLGLAVDRGLGDVVERALGSVRVGVVARVLQSGLR